MTQLRCLYNYRWRQAKPTARVVVLSCCVLITACSQQTLELKERAKQSILVADLHNRIEGLNVWNLQTRIAVRHQAWSWRGVLHWTQRQDTFKMVFTSLMGNRVMLVESLDDGSVVAIDANRKQQQTENVAAVVADLLGVAVEQDDLRFWLLGAPVSGRSYHDLQLTQSGQLSSFRQGNWLIQYNTYHDESCQSWLPKQIVLSQSETKLWLNIRSWSLPAQQSHQPC